MRVSLEAERDVAPMARGAGERVRAGASRLALHAQQAGGARARVGVGGEQSPKVGIVLDHGPRNELFRLGCARELAQESLRSRELGRPSLAEGGVRGGTPIDDARARVPTADNLAGANVEKKVEKKPIQLA